MYFLSRYDGHFVLKDLVTRRVIDIDPTQAGSRLLKVDVANVRYLDSLSFFMQPLQSLVKSFNLPVECGKDTVPHHFNTRANANYKGPFPEKKYFCPENMKPAQAEEFEKFFKEMVQLNEQYDFDAVMEKYCIKDSMLLMLVIQKYRKTHLATTGLEPFSRQFTIAGVCLEVFSALFLEENSIGVTPIGGYTSKRKASSKGKIWLDWVQHKNKVTLAREHKLGPFYPDGIDYENKVVYEFQGKSRSA